ncbi:MAG: hypothetical protein U0M41_10285 [Negativibacillus sp.]|nr:hypothetical protein [Negativibacillus sp.]
MKEAAEVFSSAHTPSSICMVNYILRSTASSNGEEHPFKCQGRILEKQLTELFFANSVQLNGTEAGNKKEDKHQQETDDIFKEKGKGIGKPKICQQQNTGCGNGSGKT